MRAQSHFPSPLVGAHRTGRLVMPGPVPGIHAFLGGEPGKQGVDGRDEPGHDDRDIGAAP